MVLIDTRNTGGTPLIETDINLWFLFDGSVFDQDLQYRYPVIPTDTFNFLFVDIRNSPRQEPAYRLIWRAETKHFDDLVRWQVWH
jgi:hypothetical protein